MIDQQIEHYLDQFLDKNYGTETFADWAGKLLGGRTRSPRFPRHGLRRRRSCRPATKPNAWPKAKSSTPSKKTCPRTKRPRNGTGKRWPKLVNTRWHLSLRDRDLKQLGRDQVGDFLIERARAALQKIDFSDGARFLSPDFGVQTACGWVRHKFGIELAPADMAELEPPAFKQLVREKAQAAYEEKETAYPVMAGLYHFTTRDASGHKHYDRDGLAHWAAQRFHVDLSVEDLKNKQRDEVRDLLVERNREFARGQAAAMVEAHAWLDRIIDPDVPIDERAAHRQRRRPPQDSSPIGSRKSTTTTCRPKRCSAATPSASNAI